MSNVTLIETSCAASAPLRTDHGKPWSEDTNSVEMHSSLQSRLTNREEIALAIAKPRGALADASS
jgi:hypothetical protein